MYGTGSYMHMASGYGNATPDWEISPRFFDDHSSRGCTHCRCRRRDKRIPRGGPKVEVARVDGYLAGEDDEHDPHGPEDINLKFARRRHWWGKISAIDLVPQHECPQPTIRPGQTKPKG